MSDPFIFPSFYVASRASRAELWRAERSRGRQIISSWIDEAGENETLHFDELWTRIEREIAASDGLLFYGHVDDAPWKDALVEVGIAIALGKPIAAVIEGKLEERTYRPVGSWLMHPAVSLFSSIQNAFIVLEVRAKERTVNFKQRVTELLMLRHIFCIDHEHNPTKALDDLLSYEVQQALDPQVSGSAAALIERGREQKTDGRYDALR